MKRMFLNRVLVTSYGFAALSGSVILTVPQAAHAQSNEAHTIYLWDGNGASDQNVAVRKWGNGKADVKKSVDYPSQSALAVTTRNFYEGARFAFTKPVDLAAYQQGGVLRLRLRSERLTTLYTPSVNSRNGQFGGQFGGNQPGSFNPNVAGGGFNPANPGGQFNPNGGQVNGQFAGGQGGPLAPGTFGGNPQAGIVSPSDENAPNPYIQNPGLQSPGSAATPNDPNSAIGELFSPGAANPGGQFNPGGFNPGGQFNPGFGGRGQFIDPSQVVPPISQIQVMLQLEKGALFGQFDYSANSENGVRPDQFGWQSFALPLRTLKATPGASGALRSIVLTGNSEGTFQIGQIALAPAGTVAVSIRRSTDALGTQQSEVTILPQTPLRLVADVETGTSDALVEWNFDADNSGSLPIATPEQPIGGAGRGGQGGQGGRRGGAGGRGGFNPGAAPTPSGAAQYQGYPGNPNPYGGNPAMGGIAMNMPRLDARGLTSVFTYPNEEQDYRVEVTVRNRLTRAEIGKSSILVRVRSAS